MYKDVDIVMRVQSEKNTKDVVKRFQIGWLGKCDFFSGLYANAEIRFYFSQKYHSHCHWTYIDMTTIMYATQVSIDADYTKLG